MKSDSIRHHSLGLACCAGILSLTIIPGTAAQNTRGGDASRSSSARVSQSGTSATDTVPVRVTRASNYLGSDVIASDGRKVGDIVDYYFDVGNSSAQLAYVLIMTGGFLNMGGDTRAVPATAVTVTGDNVRLNVSSTEYWRVPVLPEDRERFLTDPQQVQRISQVFRQSGRTAGTEPGQSTDQTAASGASTATSSGTTAATGTSTQADPNQPGAMTGRASGTQRLVSFSELRNADAFGANDLRLGFFDDAWISLNDNRVPYIEITPTFHPFRTASDRRYAVPTAKLEQEREFAGYNLNVTAEDLTEAEPVSETEGVRMLEEGEFGTTVLRVTVPRN